jgi:hypothetical protein
MIRGMFGRTACIEMISSKWSDIAEKPMGLAEQTRVNMKMLLQVSSFVASMWQALLLFKQKSNMIVIYCLIRDLTPTILTSIFGHLCKTSV